MSQEVSIQTIQSVIAVPLALRGYFFPRWYAEIEASANVLPEEEELDQFNIGLGLAFGWQYSFSVGAAVFVQPMARWLVNPGENSVFGRAQRDKLSLGVDLGFRKEF
ncbi:MAG: hypothetical protein H7246_15480 [Phycisphaerae bacterium]|nr:hypothetical protein [Saprospiraceae bacterium]